VGERDASPFNKRGAAARARSIGGTNFMLT
jgi:hypothetical protein